MKSISETPWQPSKQADVKPTTPRTYKPSKRLTGKQQAFIQHLIEKPTTPAYKAAEAAGYNGNSETLRAIASENLTKPNIQRELAKHDQTAQNTLIDVMSHSRQQMYDTDRARAVDWANTARQSATDILNRIHGTPTTRVEQTTTAVTLSINLTDDVE